MRDARGLLILLAVVVVAAAVVWFSIHRRSDETGPVLLGPAEKVLFDFGGLAVRSPDLRVGEARVRGASQGEFSSWLVTMNCGEPDGCTGEFGITLSFDTGSGDRKIVLVNGLEVPMGGELRFQGLQDPSTPVERIDKLVLEVQSIGAPTELPYGVID